MRYTSGSPAQSFEPAERDFQMVLSWLRRAYPVAEVLSAHTTIDATSAWPFDCGDVNAQLSAIRGLDVASGTDRRTHYFGLVSDGAGFMRGCASGIPQTPDPATVASGPTGSSGFAWDTDGCYGDWYTGHEFGHTFGRFHPGFCGETHDDSSYPFSNGQLSDSNEEFVGLDFGDAVLGLPMRALPGVDWHDVNKLAVHIMTVKLGTVVFMALFAAHSSGAQAAQPPKTSARIIGSFFIDPSSTLIKGGKASLIVGELRRNAGLTLVITNSKYHHISS